MPYNSIHIYLFSTFTYLYCTLWCIVWFHE